MRQVIARAPTRLDFVGGWTDVQPFCDEEPGLVVNAAFRLAARVVVRESPTPRFHADKFAHAVCQRFGVTNVTIELTSDVPMGSGLGGSGAVGVALVAAVSAYAGQALSRREIAELAHRVEVEDLGVIGGKQDQYAAAFGGFLALTFLGDSVTVEPLELNSARARELQRRSVVVYTGQARVSGDIHARVQEAFRQRNWDMLDALATIRRVARAFQHELQHGSLDALGDLLNANWEAQKRLHPATTNERVNEFFKIALAQGALGGKALGAGGGGCVYFFARDGETARLEEALRRAGGEILAAEFDFRGLERREG